MKVTNDTNYERMNPTPEGLLEKLKAYSLIDWGTDAYALSVAEARLIVSLIQIGELNRFAAQNAKQRISDLQARVVEFETIKKQHLDTVRELKEENTILKEYEWMYKELCK